MRNFSSHARGWFPWFTMTRRRCVSRSLAAHDKIAHLTRLNLIDSRGKLCNSTPPCGTRVCVSFPRRAVAVNGAMRNRALSLPAARSLISEADLQRARGRENFFLNLYAIIFFYLAGQLAAPLVSRAPWIFCLRHFNEPAFSARVFNHNRDDSFRRVQLAAKYIWNSLLLSSYFSISYFYFFIWNCLLMWNLIHICVKFVNFYCK